MMQGNVLILTYWRFDDALIQTYTLPYLRIIRKLLPASSEMYLVTLEKDNLQDEAKNSREIRMKNDGIRWVALRYRPFGIAAIMGWILDIFRLRSLISKKNISTVHCWGTPAGAIGYVLVRLTGRKLVVDSYEPHAEAMVENGTWKRNRPAFLILFRLEKLQTLLADVLVAAQAGMKDYAYEKYGVILERMLVKPACVDLDLFRPQPVKDEGLLHELGLKNKRVVVYAGKLGGIYLDKEVFAFFKEAHNRWGDQFRALLLTNQTQEEIDSWCSAADLDRNIVLRRFVPHHEVPRYLGLGDFALTPVKPVPTKRYCTPIKDGEYWAMGLPVIIPPRISDDSDIIKNEKLGAIWETLDARGYAASLDEMERLLAIPRAELQEKIRQLARRYRSLSIAEKVYAQVYGG